MSPENFVYWLQGAFELGNQITLDVNQVKIIQDHLNLVFKKETPTYDKQPSLLFPNLPRTPYESPSKWGDFPTMPVVTC